MAQNLIMIIASFVFYGWLDWRLCGLLVFSITCAYGCGLKIGASKRHGKAWDESHRATGAKGRCRSFDS